MLSSKEDDVSNIHRRWSFTRLTPNSLSASYAMTLVCAAVTVTVSHIFLLGSDLSSLALHLPLGLTIMFALSLLDSLMLRGTPINGLTKVVHVSSFASLLWALTILVGVLANALFAKSSTDYIVAGMMLAAGLRIGIFTSVFGSNLYRAILICMVMPVAFFLAFVPPQSWDILTDLIGVGFGAAFIALAIAWVVVADRAGRPHVQSTFKLLQAFLSSWTENKSGGIESMFETKAREETISTNVLRFVSASSKSEIVFPDIHPGPFGQVGGSNLSYELFKWFEDRALVMHGVSDHSLNIPSKREMDKYIIALDKLGSKDSGNMASDPVQHRQENANVTAIAFGKTVLVMLSLAPKGMEDVPHKVRKELESYATRLRFNVLVADCHNAMGDQLNERDSANLLAAARACLDALQHAPQYEFSIGFASLKDVRHSLDGAVEIGQAGLAVIVLKIGDTKYAIGWADANNMENTLRDKIIGSVKDVQMLEVCTSDTHATSGKRTRGGYFALGSATNQDSIVNAYADICRAALGRLERCSFEVLSTSSKVKVMGEKQFEDYSCALDKSMKVTKTFVGITFAAFIAMQILAE